MSEDRKRNFAALAIFVVTTTVLLIFHGSRFVATNDEGMILEPAQRMLAGARPYVDFFGYMTPGSYWLQTLAFRIFGISLWAGRLIVILDFSVQCALVFWITARIASARAAAAACLAFAGFQIADPSVLTATHRWDSATLALAGVALVLSRFKWRYLASGALLGAAAWCTPALAAVGAAVVIGTRRRDLLPFGAGIAIVTIPATGALAWTGSFGAFLHQLAWLRTNYSAVNVMSYGSIIGGYRALFDGVTGFADLIVRAILVTCVALPAIVPVVAIILTLVVRRRTIGTERLDLTLLTLSTAAFVTTVFPRSDVAHLAFVAALPFALCAAGIARLLPPRAAAGMAIFTILLAGIFGANFFTTLRGSVAVASPVGILRVPAREAASVEHIFAAVRPGSTLFVYPYMPIHYFTTQARNPTRFSFLAPGMMTNREASAVLDELQRNPPQSLLYMKLSRDEFLRVFPHASNLDWHFATLESWLEANYEPAGTPAPSVWGYALWRRCEDPRHCHASEALEARQQ